jgi:peroxiredoxin
MLKLSCAAIAVLTICISGQAQTKAEAAGLNAIYASAHGDDSYLLFHDHYDADKKYVVFKFWNEAEPLTETEKSDLAVLKKQLSKKNVELIDFQWKTKEDLEGIFKKHNLSVEVLSDKHINLKGENFNLNTTSGKALVVFEDEKPQSLCSGKDCEDHLKYFFGIKSVN